MNWIDTVNKRTQNPETAVRAIKSGDRVYLTGNCSVPRTLLSALVAYAPEINNVELCQPLTVAGTEYTDPALQGHLRVNSLFISHNVRKAVNEGRADFTPVLLSELPLLFKKGILPIDVALCHLSPPDENGYCSYGVEAGLSKTPAESAKIVIAEINDQMPTTHGDTKIHIDEVDIIVPVDYPLAELSMGGEGSPGVSENIGGFIGEIIPDGATLQMGIGALPEAVLKTLSHKKDLGIHSELFSDGLIELVESGVVNGAQKSLHPGKIVAGFIIGTRKLYRWVDNNPMIELHRTEYINNPYIIAQNDRMVAINSAIEVDLTGQVCADSIGRRLFSGVGGQADFIYGASLSRDGIPIIALPSTTTSSDGKLISRIVLSLQPGAGVTTTRNHVHYVVTEYGLVNLYGKTIRQRAQMLIAIAHPAFRAELAFQARSASYI